MVKRGLVGTALALVAATPAMAIAELPVLSIAGAFLASGLALGAAALVPQGRDGVSSVSPASTGPTLAADMSDAAFTVADCLGVAAFRVDRAGRALAANTPGLALLVPDEAAMAGEACLFLDVLASEHRATAMAAIGGRDPALGAPARVRLADGSIALLRTAPVPGRAGGGEEKIAFLSLEPAGSAEPIERSEVAGPEDAPAIASAVLATVSHELRTPLNAIIGFSGILEQEIFGALGNARQREYVALIQQSGRHLLSVVNELLDVSKLQAGRYELRPERFEIGPLLDDAAAMVRCEAMEKGLDLDIADDCGAVTLAADRRALKQMVLNLLANAVKFTDKGAVSLACRFEDGDLVVTVSDTGIGIPEAEIGKLGRPFVQASCGHRRHFEGTGLGLAYVRGMAELHGGTMAISSREDVGTIVTLRFPAAPSCDPSRIDDNSFEALTHARIPEDSQPLHRAPRRSA